jgi:hypothetical protein
VERDDTLRLLERALAALRRRRRARVAAALTGIGLIGGLALIVIAAG